MLGHKIPQRSAYFLQMSIQGGTGIDLHAQKQAGPGVVEEHRVITYRALPQMAQIMSRVGGDQKNATASSGLLQG
ncbi:hypothetical protein GCM10025777_46520 [Membranihabitans marinus]|uniref:Uncharacterized protein n=1 Tax=Nesterenkonia rhizosphaerae TaxID=1348272 RepID=A0ABP9FVI2_9MICC